MKNTLSLSLLPGSLCPEVVPPVKVSVLGEKYVSKNYIHLMYIM